MRIALRSRPRRTYITAAVLAAALIMWFSAPDSGCIALADHTPPDYCHRFDVTVTNNSAAALTNYPVRFTINAAALVANAQIDSRGWDLRPVQGSFSNEVNLLAQDMTGTSAAWWMQADSIPAGASITLRAYTGSDEQKRNQGIAFTGSDSVTVAHHAPLNVTDEVQAEATVIVFDSDAQNATLIAHWSADQGYGLFLADSGGGLVLRARVDTATLDLAWDSAWNTGDHTFAMDYDAPTLRILHDGTEVATQATGLGSITSASTPLAIGSGLSDAIILEARLIESIATSPVVIAQFGFDARYLSESTDVDPTYTGTITNYQGSVNDAAYSFTRDQSALTVLVGAISLTSAASTASLPSSIVGLLPQTLDSSFLTPTPENVFGLGYTFLSPPAGTGYPDVLQYTMVLSTIGLVLGAAGFMATRNTFIALFMAAVPLGYGAINGWVPAWWLLVWAMLVIALYGAHQWSQRGT